jgi:hypothetical protein
VRARIVLGLGLALLLLPFDRLAHLPFLLGEVGEVRGLMDSFFQDSQFPCRLDALGKVFRTLERRTGEASAHQSGPVFLGTVSATMGTALGSSNAFTDCTRDLPAWELPPT